jgi:hypothetical protein
VKPSLPMLERGPRPAEGFVCRQTGSMPDGLPSLRRGRCSATPAEWKGRVATLFSSFRRGLAPADAQGPGRERSSSRAFVRFQQKLRCNRVSGQDKPARPANSRTLDGGIQKSMKE